MSKKTDETIQEEFQLLEELVRKAESLISPISMHDHLKTLLDPEKRLDHYKRHPKCYLSMGIGRKHALFPICTMSGHEDPAMVKFSIKMANKLYGRKDVDADSLNVIVQKLTRLEGKLVKSTVKPDRMSVLKAKATKSLNKNLKNIK